MGKYILSPDSPIIAQAFIKQQQVELVAGFTSVYDQITLPNESYKS